MLKCMERLQCWIETFLHAFDVFMCKTFKCQSFELIGVAKQSTFQLNKFMKKPFHEFIRSRYFFY